MFRLLALILAIAVPVISRVYYWGPCRYIAEFQQSEFGIEYVNLTVVVGMLAALGLLFPPAMALDRRFAPKWFAVGARRFLAWKGWPAIINILPHGYSAVFALIGAVLLALAPLSLFEAWRAGPPSIIDMQSIMQGERPVGRYVHLRNCALITTQPLRLNSDAYFAVVPYGEDQLGPFCVFVSHFYDADKSGPLELKGSVEFNGLPGALQARLEDRRLLSPHYFVIKSGSTREEDIDTACSAIKFAVILLVVCFAWSGTCRYVAAKRQQRNLTRPRNER